MTAPTLLSAVLGFQTQHCRKFPGFARLSWYEEQMKKSVEQWWDDNERGEPKYSATSSTTIPKWTGPGIEPRPSWLEADGLTFWVTARPKDWSLLKWHKIWVPTSQQTHHVSITNWLVLFMDSQSVSAVETAELCGCDVQQFGLLGGWRPAATLTASLLVECLVIFHQELLTAVRLVGCDAV